MNYKFEIEDVTPADYPFVLRVNEENVEVLSPMDEERLAYFLENAELFKVIKMDGERAAFIIAIKDGARNDSPDYGVNYAWFSQRYPRFLYVDRIVIDQPFRRMGLGRKIYEFVENHAREIDSPYVTCEVDTLPYNEASLKFHDEMGYVEVGTQVIRGGTVEVSMRAKKILRQP